MFSPLPTRFNENKSQKSIALRKDGPVLWKSCQDTEGRVIPLTLLSPCFGRIQWEVFSTQSSTDSMWLVALPHQSHWKPSLGSDSGRYEACAQKLGKTKSLEYLVIHVFIGDHEGTPKPYTEGGESV